jgi:hypothetical protein
MSDSPKIKKSQTCSPMNDTPPNISQQREQKELPNDDNNMDNSFYKI